MTKHLQCNYQQVAIRFQSNTFYNSSNFLIKTFTGKNYTIFAYQISKTHTTPVSILHFSINFMCQHTPQHSSTVIVKLIFSKVKGLLNLQLDLIRNQTICLSSMRISPNLILKPFISKMKKTMILMLTLVNSKTSQRLEYLVS